MKPLKKEVLIGRPPDSGKIKIGHQLQALTK